MNLSCPSVTWNAYIGLSAHQRNLRMGSRRHWHSPFWKPISVLLFELYRSQCLCYRTICGGFRVCHKHPLPSGNPAVFAILCLLAKRLLLPVLNCQAMAAIEILGYDVFSTPGLGVPRSAALEHQTSGFHAAAVVPQTEDVSDLVVDGRDEMFFPELVRVGLSVTLPGCRHIVRLLWMFVELLLIICHRRRK